MPPKVQILDYDSRGRRNLLTLTKSALRYVRLAFLGLILATAILATVLAAVAFVTPQKITICNNWEVSSHWGGVSVWRKITLSATDHRIVVHVHSERNEDANARPIRTTTLQRRPNVMWNGSVVLFTSVPPPPPAVFDGLGIRYDYVSRHINYNWTDTYATLCLHPV